jgi:hypothetical protein
MKTKVFIYKVTGNIVLLHMNVLCSIVEFPFGISYLCAELGGLSNFEYIGEFV